MSDPAKPFSLDKPDPGEKPRDEPLPDALVIEPRAGAGSASIGTRHPLDGGVEQHPVHDSDAEDLAPEDFEELTDEIAKIGIKTDA